MNKRIGNALFIKSIVHTVTGDSQETTPENKNNFKLKINCFDYLGGGTKDWQFRGYSKLTVFGILKTVLKHYFLLCF